MPPETRSLKRIHFQDLSDPNGQSIPVDRHLILNTDMKLTFAGAVGQDPSLAWKLMLLRGDPYGYYTLEHYWQQSEKPLDEFAKELGLSYQLNDDQTIDSIYLPWCSEMDLKGLENIRVLSFDPSWVEGESTVVGAAGAPTQIPSVVRKVTGPVGFDACQTLESITFFGKPDIATYREISRLTNLKRLVIVNSDSDATLTDEYLNKVRKKFPGIDASILAASEVESLVPEPFREYRDRSRKELRADTSWLDELLK